MLAGMTRECRPFAFNFPYWPGEALPELAMSEGSQIEHMGDQSGSITLPCVLEEGGLPLLPGHQRPPGQLGEGPMHLEPPSCECSGP